MTGKEERDALVAELAEKILAARTGDGEPLLRSDMRWCSPSASARIIAELAADALAAATGEAIETACEAVWLWANGHEDRFEAMNDLTHALRSLKGPTP